MRTMNICRWLLAALAVAMLASAQTASAISAMGGNATNIGANTFHVFTNSGTFTVTGDGTIEVLVVAGGGSGGYNGGGGGGAGGVLHTNALAVTNGQVVTVTVGPGAGTTSYSSSWTTSNGMNSVFGPLTAIGGGGGASRDYGARGASGGSGGGGGGATGSGGRELSGTNNAAGQGNNGGNGTAPDLGTSAAGGGGGGAGSAGTAGTSQKGGNGGTGVYYAVFAAVGGAPAGWFAGGGAGGLTSLGTAGTGGTNGGGGNVGVAGVRNTGGGGGANAAGGYGVVIVRYDGVNPVIGNLAVSNVTYTSATLNGYLTSTGASPTLVSVYWGTNDGGMVAANWQYTNVFADAQVVGSLSTNVTFGVSNVAYFYRFYATNTAGESWASPAASFVAGDVTVAATDAAAIEAVTDTVTFAISRPVLSTNTALAVNYTFGGTASNGVDYTASPASCVTIAVGAVSATVTVTPFLDFRTEGAETVSLTVASGPYAIGSPSSADATLDDAPMAPVVATGGIVTNIGGYRIHTFTNGIAASNLIVSAGGLVEVLMVAGGGGGGETIAGGGGGGGLIYTNSYLLLPGTNQVVVGAGGNGASGGGWLQGANGGNSSLGMLLAYGGGGGGGWNAGTGRSGGSGGGGSGGSQSGVAGTNSPSNGQGKNGGTGNGNSSGGGGGAGSAGTAGVSGSQSGRGGTGLVYSISGAATYYAGGGGGGGGNGAAGGAGGLGGGGLGTGNNSGLVGSNGVPCTGGGGGGGSYSPATGGGKGGSGIVIVRYDTGVPRLTHLDAANVSATSADLNGSLTSTGMSATAVTVYWGTNDGQNVAANWGFTNNTALPAPQNPGPVTLNVAGLAPNTTYYYRFYATNDQGEMWASTSQVFITGGLTVQATDPTAAENGPDAGTFTISRPDWATNAALTVNYTVGGTAVNGVDYTNLSGSVVIPAGASNAAVTVTPIADAIQEASETVDLTLAPGGYAIGTPSNATVTIADGTWYVATNGLDSNGGTGWADALATISNAVAHATAGQLVLVSNGVYLVPAPIAVAKAVTVRGYNGASNTVVNGGGVTRCFTLSNAGAVLDGLTVSNGYVGASGQGGGIHMTGGIVKNSVVTRSTAGLGGIGYGGGLYMNGGRLESCTVLANKSGGNSSQGAGGGIYATGGALVTNCTIIGNAANDPGGWQDQGYGGGIYLTGGCTLIDSLVATNRTRSLARPSGGGVYIADGASLVARCRIIANQCDHDTAVYGTPGYQALQGGAGVNMQGGTLRNCLVAGNSYNSSEAQRYGGGVRMDGGTMQNCTVTRNYNVNSVGGVHVAAGAVVVNAIAADNSAASGASNINTTVGVTCSCGPELTGGAGNLADPPLFASAGSGFGTAATVGDKHLQLISPCVDAGAGQSYSNDLEGVARPLDGDGNGTASYDMGCYELSAASLPFSCGFDGVPAAGLAPLTVQFTAFVAGANTNIASYVWDFTNDGTPDATGPDKRVVSFEYAAEGTYTVALRVTNTLDEITSIVRTNYIVASPITHVSPSGSHSAPYTSWGTAATNVQTAINSAAAGSLVLVTDGVYRVSTAISLAKALTVRSVNGAGTTTIDGGQQVRCISVAQPSAVVDGFTLCNGYAAGGAGAYITDGTVQNCIIRNNRDSGTANGGGVWMSFGTLRNCVVAGNRSGAGTYGNGRGGGVALSGGAIEHCTIARNMAGASAGGVYKTGGAVVNTIVYDNRALLTNNIDSVSGVTNSCAPELISGPGNITGNPQFVDTGIGYGYDYVMGDFRLGVGSPCVDAGTNQTGTLTDLTGAVRPVDGNGDGGAVSDMGAYETLTAVNAGALRCHFFTQTPTGAVPLSAVFVARVAGSDTNISSYAWDFTSDGSPDVVGAGRGVVTNTYNLDSAWYTVTLTVTNGSGETATCIRTNYIQTPFNAAYVWQNGGHVPPYTNWTTAANDLQAAIEAIEGTNTPVVWVTNGTHNVTVPVYLYKGVTVRSVGGSSNAIVNGGGATRCFTLNHPAAVLDGFTATNGYVGAYGQGGGLYMNGGLVRNCAITRSMAYVSGVGYGGGVYMNGGRLESCTVSSNRCGGNSSTGAGGGIYATGGATVTNCTIVGNTMNDANYHDIGYGGGIYMAGGSTLVDSLIATNRAVSLGITSGGGVYVSDGASLVANCRIVGNRCDHDSQLGAPGSQALQGGAGVNMQGGTLRNCLVAGNSYTPAQAVRIGGGVRMDGGRMENCTVVRNYNVNPVGGVYVGGAATVTNCIVYHNSGSSTNDVGPTNKVGNSCAPELTGGAGNASGDPRFKAAGSGFGVTSVAGDYHLAGGSPCLNSGATLTWTLTGVDLEGKQRLVNGLVDMGVYENQSPAGSSFVFR